MNKKKIRIIPLIRTNIKKIKKEMNDEIIPSYP